MAIGDDASAAGFDLVASTGKVRDGADEINKTRDYIAQVKTVVDAATATATEGNLMKYGTGGRVNVATPTTGGNATNKTYVDNAVSQKAEADTVANLLSGEFNGDPYNRDITHGGRRTVVIAPGAPGFAEIGYSSSKRSSKQNITDANLEEELLRAIPVVFFKYKAAVAAQQHGGPEAQVEIGTIADDLHELGLVQFVAYEGDDPAGVHYERLSLAALALAQTLADRLDALTARVEALEGD